MALSIDVIPNRSSPPAILLREAWRKGKRIRRRTVATLSKMPPALDGGVTFPPLDAAVAIRRSRPHGHVAAAVNDRQGDAFEILAAPRKGIALQVRARHDRSLGCGRGKDVRHGLAAVRAELGARPEGAPARLPSRSTRSRRGRRSLRPTAARDPVAAADHASGRVVRRRGEGRRPVSSEAGDRGLAQSPEVGLQGRGNCSPQARACRAGAGDQCRHRLADHGPDGTRVHDPPPASRQGRPSPTRSSRCRPNSRGKGDARRRATSAAPSTWSQ